MVKTILIMLTTYSVATAILLGGASALGLMPQSGVDGKDGADGAPGRNGTDGAAAILKTYVVTNNGPEFSEVQVSCRSGDTLIGGGANNLTGFWWIVASYPSGNSWVAIAESELGRPRGKTLAYAICQDNP